MYDELKDRRVILAARVSGDTQVKDGIPRQIELGHESARRYGMHVVDTVELKGKSATLREHVPELLDLLKRKREKNDFDTLWFLTISRFDRSRAEGDQLFAKFEKAGITIITDRQGTFGGKWGWIKRNISLQEAQGYVEDMAVHTATGSMRMIRDGILPTSPGYVYGTDRMYLDADGKPQFILRRVSPWRAEKRHPETGNVEGIIEWDGESRRLSLRLPGGKVKLIPGDPSHIEIVRRIYHLHYVERWGAARIVELLNKEKVPAPRKGDWNDSTITHILRNAVYTGIGIANMSSRGKFVSRGKNGPTIYDTPREPRMRVRDETVQCKHVYKANLVSAADAVPKEQRIWLRINDQLWMFELRGGYRRSGTIYLLVHRVPLQAAGWDGRDWDGVIRVKRDRTAEIVSENDPMFMPLEEWDHFLGLPDGMEFRIGGSMWKKLSSSALRAVTQKGTLVAATR